MWTQSKNRKLNKKKKNRIGNLVIDLNKYSQLKSLYCLVLCVNFIETGVIRKEKASVEEIPP